MITKLTATFLIPGTIIDPERSIKESVTVSYMEEKGKAAKPKKEKLFYSIHKRVPAKQVINITDEAYNYWISKEVPEFADRATWNKMGKERKIVSHLEQIALNIKGKLLSYDIFPD